MIRSRRGAGLVEAMIAIFFLGIAGIIFSTSFPIGFSSFRQSSEETNATTIARRKIEQVRSLSYKNLTYANLRAAGFIDLEPTTSPYYFTSVDSVNTALHGGFGTLAITPETGEVKRVTVSVNWRSQNGIARNVTVATFIADTSPWVR